MIFKEKKENLIKVFEVDKDTKTFYIINTFLNIINRWQKIRIYIYDIQHEISDYKNGKEL